MATAVTSALSLWHRVEKMLQERFGRKVVPAEEATLLTMAESPRATVGLSPEQKRQLAELDSSIISAR
jgi:hypothetical protein